MALLFLFSQVKASMDFTAKPDHAIENHYCLSQIAMKTGVGSRNTAVGLIPIHELLLYLKKVH